MDTIILLILLLIVFLFTCKGKFEKYSLNFPKSNKLKCKCDLKSKVKEGFAQYDKTKKKYPTQLDRIYHIWKPVNDITAESFYENKYSYPFFPENDSDKSNLVKSSNSKDYDNIGLKNQKVLPKSYKNGFLPSYKYTFGLQYEP